MQPLTLLLAAAVAQTPAPPADRIEVCVTTRAVAPGRAIVAEDLGVIRLPPDYVPKVAFRDCEPLVGRVAREWILAFELVREERLADLDTAPGADSMIPRGMVSLELRLPRPSAHPRAGDWLDLVERTPTGLCALARAALVVGVEGPDGFTSERTSALHDRVYLALTPAERAAVAASTARVPLYRDPKDLSTLELPPCSGGGQSAIPK